MSGSPETVLVDDHAVVRHGLRAALEAAGITVAAEAADVEGGWRKVVVHRPAVAVVDLRLGPASGLELVRRVRRSDLPTRTLVLTVSGVADDLLRAVLAGAAGYVLKDAAPSDVADAVRTTATGGTVVSPGVAGALLAAVRERDRAPAAVPVGEHDLSPRELDVLRLLADGEDNRAIGRALWISPHTVKHHVTSVVAKLGARGRTDAAVTAARRGLV